MLESLQNEQVKYVVSLQRRKVREEAQLFVVEGWRFVEEAVSRKAPIKKVYICQEREPLEWQSLQKRLCERNIPFEEVDGRVLRKMSSTEEPQGILAVVHQTNHSWSDLQINPKTVLLILDGIQDPGNLGTILRTALASGVRYVCLTPGTVDLYNPKVLRSTMGALFSLVLLIDKQPKDILNFCRERKLSILMGDIQGCSVYHTKLPEGPLALVVGNEGKGPSPLFRSLDVQRVTIPMAQDVESLNVAIATGILLYEIVRQRDFL
ncbi:RNA 2'-O ribose methyltransferase substrate binding family protein [Candidatus Desulfosporosinus infrequens]|uniref:RNA 2'-O ribose methyltransferase substrate binding family protein n=1 Tax=Candidatus Desulfosporosinus infrequens TaxID=2043169 RepID=A0A2U3K554_9FIRM|nr:RNA 2'-O ribose methyltransferase substrate binding family protein [Candidatus Desulfosporosinus infrequens]